MDAVFQPEVRHGGITLPWRSFLLGTGAVAAYLILGAVPEAWVFDRAAIAQGEWWRLITGHWVHSDLAHAGWDITALLLLGALFEMRLQWRLPLALMIGTIGVDAWLWWGEPLLRYYCGLSGILNSLLIVGLLQLWREQRHPLVLLTGVGAAVKIIVEINTGQALLTETAWPSVPMVHAAGFLCGLVLGWGIRTTEAAYATCKLAEGASIRSPVQTGTPQGDASYRKQIERTLQCRVGQIRRRRPPKTSEKGY
ncbi:MAG: rhombosortase [Gammaproteobacteria bacterium]|nr:rhombosortase [Gammaproteobacteria bacterium]MDH3559611.1 rhombosortase [Gammaproteobacteria bacterium]